MEPMRIGDFWSCFETVTERVRIGSSSLTS